MICLTNKPKQGRTRASRKICWLLIVSISTLALLARGATATVVSDNQEEIAAVVTTSPGGQDGEKTNINGHNSPANHRMEEPTVGEETKLAGPSHRRNGRQYDGPLSTSGTGNYAAYSGDTGAYVGSGPNPGSLGTGYSTVGATAAAAASNGPISGYASEPLGANMYSPAGNAVGYHPDQLARAGYPLPMHAGYPSPPMHSQFGSIGGGHGSGGGGPLASMFPSSTPGGLFSSGFPLMAKGFDISEIVCTAIAVAIGAVIVGAPFILLYLFVMNQMQGNGGGPSAMGPNGGSISLTGPTSSTNVSGRKKRHTSLPEALFKQLSPLVNNEQVAQTFKALMNSMAKYQA